MITGTSKAYSPSDIKAIAIACHEANREYCQSIGDDSQVSWDDAEQWQRDSACSGVSVLLGDPNKTPLNMHQNWMADKAADGWKYGKKKDPKKKTHPCMVPYDELPVEQREKDKIFIATVLNFKGAIDNPVTEAEPTDTPPVIQLSIRELCRLTRNRLENVMAQTGKRPGDLVAISADLAEMAHFDHSLMDVTD